MDKILSFDMDGTLIDQSFADAVWLKGIPRLYAAKKDICFQEAQKYIHGEYEKIGSAAIEWYDIHYWLKKLGLGDNWKSLLNSYRHKITLYPEVHHVLNNLKEKYPLVIISNAAREFLNIELETTGLKHYFHDIFSAVTDFKQTKKAIQIYQNICDTLDIDPSRMIHVGDDYHFDYLTPRKLGITSFYLNRNQHCSPCDNYYIITNLWEFTSKIQGE